MGKPFWKKTFLLKFAQNAEDHFFGAKSGRNVGKMLNFAQLNVEKLNCSNIALTYWELKFLL